jgi:Tfp pilus assembly pilus retraction ATPase PilT
MIEQDQRRPATTTSPWGPSKTRSNSSTQPQEPASSTSREVAARYAFKSAAALRTALRQDPDIVLVGGNARSSRRSRWHLRNAETATWTVRDLQHRFSVTRPSNRIIRAFFLPRQPNKVRRCGTPVCRSCLEGIDVANRVLPKAMPATDDAIGTQSILVPNAAIRNLIREDKGSHPRSTRRCRPARKDLVCRL